MGFYRLSRKRKKAFKKHPKYYKGCGMPHWEQVYFPERVMVKAMQIVIHYPKIAITEELITWYGEHYPNDKKRMHFAKEKLTRHKNVSI